MIKLATQVIRTCSKQQNTALTQTSLVKMMSKRSFSGKPAIDMRLKEIQPEERLAFINRTANLRQIFLRLPNDGLFPAIKAVEELTEADVPNLVKQ